MDAKYKDIGLKAVFSDKTKDGLFVQFLREYEREFGEKINPSCPKCRARYWDNYLKSFEMAIEKKAKSGYVLKGKYNGIQLGHGGKPMRNGEFTDAEAKKLIKIHALGEGLFSVIPEEPKKKAPAKKKATKSTAKK